MKESTSLQDLINGCKSNNRVYQELLYRRYFNQMMAMCTKYLQNKEDALTVLNDGFLKVFKKIDTIQTAESLDGWISRVIYNTILDHLRSTKTYRNTISLFETIYESEKVEQESQTDYIWRLIEKLPTMTKSVFYKYAIEGYSHKEISEQLNINENTSKWHLFEARSKLKKWLDVNYIKKTMD